MENMHTGFGCKELKEVLLFQTTSAASWLSQKMSQDGHSVTLIVDEMAEDERFRAQRKLFSGSERLLITTVDFDLETPEVKN